MYTTTGYHRPMRDYKKIKAWQRGHRFMIAVHKLLRRFPRVGYGHLKAQLGKSSGSMPTNIVEGCIADSNKEFARYLAVSIRSANETEEHLLTAKDLGLLEPTKWHRFTNECTEIRKMTIAYRKKVLEDE
jgi:four helix bundle protein